MSSLFYLMLLGLRFIDLDLILPVVYSLVSFLNNLNRTSNNVCQFK